MRARERGATAVTVAVVLAVLLGFVALSLDVGHVLSVRGELQNGADAGALAGARMLTGRNTNNELGPHGGAVSEARNFARSHPTDVYDVEPTTIQLGAWIPEGDACPPTAGGVTASRYGYKFCQIGGTTEDAAADVNAVRVVAQRSGAPGAAAGGGAVELAFGAFGGRRDPAPVEAEAIAVAGGPCTQRCPDLPVAIRAGCLYEDGEIRCGDDEVGPLYYIGFTPSPTDSAGLTSLSDSIPANANAACDILRAADGCTPIQEGVQINIQNGESTNAACDPGCPWQSYYPPPGGGIAAAGHNDKLCEVIRRRADSNCDGVVDDFDADGRPDFRRQVPVVKYAEESLDYCGGNYNQQAEIVGWATIAIVSARCEPTSRIPFGAVPITRLCDEEFQRRGDFTANKDCFVIQLYCDEEDDEQSRIGCGWFGTRAPQPVLVR